MRNNLVVQSNALIEAHYKQEYSVQEQRTILWLISEVHKEDYLTKNYERKLIRITAKDYADLMGICVDNVYRDAEKIADDLGSKRFTIRTSAGWINFGWISSMEYKKGKGIIEAEISEKILPYIIDLKKQFTSFRLENVLYLKSSHAIKLYQLLSQYKKIGMREIRISDLKSILGIENLTTYKLYGNIKSKIFEISKREINSKTDLVISYTEIKKGRKVEAVKFKITQKNKLKTNLIDADIPHTKLKLTTNEPQKRVGMTNEDFNPKVMTTTLEKAKNLIMATGTGWDLYAIEAQFYEYMKKVGAPKNLDSAFIGFVKKKIAKRS
jgi:plasmid replication initiation protein